MSETLLAGGFTEVESPDSPAHYAREVELVGLQLIRVYGPENERRLRRSLQPGVSHVELKPPPAGPNEDNGGRRHGYHYYLQDAGPKYWVSVSVENVSEDLVVTLHVTNTFIRHMSVFTSFLKEDGKTAMKVPPERWLELL